MTDDMQNSAAGAENIQEISGAEFDKEAEAEKYYKFGIIGYPLGHSLSSVMHMAALKDLGLKGEYNALETDPEDLVDRIKMLKRENYFGFNVTIPHKVPISLFLSKVDEYANLAGSVNTVKILEDKSLEGFNTDIYGFIKPIENLDLKGKSAAILGTGGAARGVIVGLKSLGVSRIDFYTRNIVDSHAAIEGFRKKFPEITINLVQNEFLNTVSMYSIVVNTTPLGMKGKYADISPLSDEIVKTLPDDGLIYDIVYNPIKTELIKKAEKYGKKYIGGLDMLVYQGARAFEIWTQKAPNPDKMKIAALEQLLNNN